MNMPQLQTGTSMPESPPLRLLPMLASNHSTLHRSPAAKSRICLHNCFMVDQHERTRERQVISSREIYQFTTATTTKLVSVN